MPKRPAQGLTKARGTSDDAPPEHHRVLARHLADAWGGWPRIIEMTAKGTRARQAIAVLKDYPKPGVTAYATIGLCDHGGSEIASLSASRNKSFIKAIFDVASYVHEGRRKAKSGGVFEKALARYYPRANTGHLRLSDSPLPGLRIPVCRVGRKSVHWLSAWPTTSDELVLIESAGPKSVRAQLERPRVDLADLDRPNLPGVLRLDRWAKTSRGSHI